MESEKAFKLSAVVHTGMKAPTALDKNTVQTDQGSDMNAISISLAHDLGLQFHSLLELGMEDISIMTANSN